MSLTSSATTYFSDAVQIMISKELEEQLLPNLPHLMPGHYRKATFIKGSNAQMRFLNIPNLAISTNAGTVSAGTAPWLTEGVAPTNQTLAFGFEEFTAYQAGQTLGISDVAAQEFPLDLLAEGAKVVARQAAEVIDEYVGRIVAAGTNVIYAGSGNAARTDVGATDVLTGRLVRQAVQTNKADNIPMFGDGGYHAIIHPNVILNLEDDVDVGGWLQVGQYSAPGAIQSGEIGKYAGVRFFESPRARKFAAGGAGSADIYSTVILGTEAYAFGDFGTLRATYKPFGSAGTADPLDQLATLGWKAFIGAFVIGEGANAQNITAVGPRYVRIESGVSTS
jgi:N4-gp56 family major capsid protein